MTKALNMCSSHQLLGRKKLQQSNFSRSEVTVSSAAEFLIRKFKGKLMQCLKKYQA